MRHGWNCSTEWVDKEFNGVLDYTRPRIKRKKEEEEGEQEGEEKEGEVENDFDDNDVGSRG